MEEKRTGSVQVTRPMSVTIERGAARDYFTGSSSRSLSPLLPGTIDREIE